jgi:hypothetical protein
MLGRAATALAILLCVAPPTSAQEETPPPRYSIRQAEPEVGTHIPRNLVVGAMPFNKAYADLTQQQQSQLKSQYEQMGEGDEPPYPLKGTRAIYKALSDAQQKLLVTGNLYMLADVDSQGQATAVSVMQSPDPQMTQVAAAALLLERYKPARCGGVPCSMQFPLVITFEKKLQ